VLALVLGLIFHSRAVGLLGLAAAVAGGGLFARAKFAERSEHRRSRDPYPLGARRPWPGRARKSSRASCSPSSGHRGSGAAPWKRQPGASPQA